MRKFFYLVFFLLCINKVNLEAGVFEVIVSWKAATCRELCIPRVEKSLHAIPQVSNLRISAYAGSAKMNWDPLVPFNYEVFRFAAGAAGIYFREVRIKVSGYIEHAEGDFFLISDGDGARFRLIGPAEIQPGRYIAQSNIATHHLTTRMQDALLEAEYTDQLLILSGPLFWPRTRPRTLIVEQIQVPKEERRR